MAPVAKMPHEPTRRALTPRQLSINLAVSVVGAPHNLLLVDLTTLGMKLSGALPLNVGDTHDFVVDLGVIPSLSPPRLALRGSVRWCSPDLAPDRTLIGVQFASLTPEVHLAVQRIIDRLAL